MNKKYLISTVVLLSPFFFLMKKTVVDVYKYILKKTDRKNENIGLVYFIKRARASDN